MLKDRISALREANIMSRSDIPPRLGLHQDKAGARDRRHEIDGQRLHR